MDEAETSPKRHRDFSTQETKVYLQAVDYASLIKRGGGKKAGSKND